MKKKPDYWYKQSAVIPFRILNGNYEILVIRSRKDKKWIFPKGIIDPGFSAGESALKEAEEEAGVIGILLPDNLGNYSYKKWGGKCKVEVFAMEVHEVLEEWQENFRLRKWVDINEIEKFIFSKKQIITLEHFKQKVGFSN